MSSEKGGKAEGSQAKTVFSGGGKDETLAAGSSHNRRTENWPLNWTTWWSFTDDLHKSTISGIEGLKSHWPGSGEIGKIEIRHRIWTIFFYIVSNIEDKK